MHHIVWDWPIFLSQLFGFAVVLYVLNRSVKPRVREAMAKSQNTIRTQLEDSRRAAIQVVAAAEAHEAALAQAELAKSQFEREAHAAAEQILAEMRAEAEEVAVRTRRQGRARVYQARREFVEQLRSDLHTAVLDRAEYMVRHRLATPPARSGSVDRFLDDLEEVNARRQAA
ncbi:F0F1 ATP synthase subunit B family protein [Nocardia goodfellowii]